MLNIAKIYEDEYILALDKPSGIAVNRSDTMKDPTIQDYLENELGMKIDPIVEETETEDEYPSEFSSRTGIVHRLDKDTSGVLLIAKTEEVFKDLIRQFKERETKKEYIALVHGKVAYELFEIDAPIKRNPTSPMKMGIVADGKEAFTSFERLKVITIGEKKYTLLRAIPKTGRTHQIRVHLTAADHTIAHDPIYCTQKVFEEDTQEFSRLMLHAQRLFCVHPVTNEELVLESPLPIEFDM